MAIKNTGPVVPIIQKVDAAKVPGSAKRGRERTPSMFDDWMTITDEWVCVTYSSQDELKKHNAELTRALKFANENADKDAQVGIERRTGIDGLYFLVGPKRVTTRSNTDKPADES